MPKSRNRKKHKQKVASFRHDMKKTQEAIRKKVYEEYMQQVQGKMQDMKNTQEVENVEGIVSDDFVIDPLQQMNIGGEQLPEIDINPEINIPDISIEPPKEEPKNDK